MQNQNDSELKRLVKKVSGMISQLSGNRLGLDQENMVSTRLQRRMRQLGFEDPVEYTSYLEKHYDEETKHLISLLTTHHTFFFREFCHFEFLLENLQEIIQSVRNRPDKKLKVLSVACSKGHEVYSLATFLSFHLKNEAGIDFEVHGCDIDASCVGFAKNGVYEYKHVKEIPHIYLSGFWQRGKGEIQSFAKIKSFIKEKCHFFQSNVLEDDSRIDGQDFDIIMCRNMFIYFEEDAIKKIVNRLLKSLQSNGYFITGVSESIQTASTSLKLMGSSVYHNQVETESDSKFEKVQSIKERVVVPKKPLIPDPIRVLVVDDSKSICALMKKIFSNDPKFQLVGTAYNGVEAEEFLKNNSVDALTLDIHMPEKNGIQYLQDNYSPSHPKVLMVSSAKREDTEFSQKALSLGASDFVEKPSLNDLQEKTEEIKSKLKMMFLNTDQVKVSNLELYKQDHTIMDLEQKCRILLCDTISINQVHHILNQLSGAQPAIIVAATNRTGFESLMKEKFMGQSSTVLVDTHVRSGLIYIADLMRDIEIIDQLKKRTSVGILSLVERETMKRILAMPDKQVMLEEKLEDVSYLALDADDIFPYTSFAHLGNEFLSEEVRYDKEA